MWPPSFWIGSRAIGIINKQTATVARQRKGLYWESVLFVLSSWPLSVPVLSVSIFSSFLYTRCIQTYSSSSISSITICFLMTLNLRLQPPPFSWASDPYFQLPARCSISHLNPSAQNQCRVVLPDLPSFSVSILVKGIRTWQRANPALLRHSHWSCRQQKARDMEWPSQMPRAPTTKT